MPDFKKRSHEFFGMVSGVGRANPLEAIERPVDAYSPCWCRSGAKWKFCHKDREKQPKLSFGEVQARTSKHFLVGQCLHPTASSERCSGGQPIQSHTIQRRGGLAAVAEDGHVYSAKKGFFDIEKNEGQVDMKKLGVGKASTFPGFCSRHDTEMFKPVEQVDATLNAWNGFLLSFRAVAYELATKVASLEVSRETRGHIDKGHPFEVQSAIQNFMFAQQQGIKLGIRDVKLWKAEYDKAFTSRDLSSFRLYGITFNKVLPFVASGAFMPEFDYSGQELQQLAAGQVTGHVALNITRLGDKTCAVFGWTGGVGGPAARLVESFKELPDDQKADALLVLALEYLENFFCTPSWWEGLSPKVSKRLHDNMAGGMPSRRWDALIEPGIGAVSCGVERVAEN
jgi:hypothetical protein